MKKRLATGVLALSMILAVTLPSFAADTNEGDKETKTAKVREIKERGFRFNSSGLGAVQFSKARSTQQKNNKSSEQNNPKKRSVATDGSSSGKVKSFERFKGENGVFFDGTDAKTDTFKFARKSSSGAPGADFFKFPKTRSDSDKNQSPADGESGFDFSGKLFGRGMMFPDFSAFEAYGLAFDKESGTLSYNGKKVALIADGEGRTLYFRDGDIYLKTISGDDGKITGLVEMTTEEVDKIKADFEARKAEMEKKMEEMKAEFEARKAEMEKDVQDRAVSFEKRTNKRVSGGAKAAKQTQASLEETAAV